MDRVVHFELPADDMGRAKRFYEQVFGWALSDVPGMNYVIARTTSVDDKQVPREVGAINGGMLKRSELVTAPTFSIDVDSIDDAIEKVEAQGGMILKGKTPVGNMGSVAYFKDTEGNVLSLWQSG